MGSTTGRCKKYDFKHEALACTIRFAVSEILEYNRRARAETQRTESTTCPMRTSKVRLKVQHARCVLPRCALKYNMPNAFFQGSLESTTCPMRTSKERLKVQHAQGALPS
jgi:hypothetical protein